MADPIIQFERELHDLMKFLDTLREKALGEHALLTQLQGLLRQFHSKALAINDQRLLQATEKSVKKQSFKLIRRAERAQRFLLESREEFFKAVEQFFAKLDKKYHAHIQGTKLLLQVQGYSNLLLRHISKKEGIISTAIREGRLEAATEPLRDATAKALWPLLGTLEQIQTYFQEHQLEYKVAVGEATHFTLDMESVFKEQGVVQAGTIILDADFAKAVSQQKANAGKVSYNFKIPPDRIVIPQRIFHEMTFKPAFVGHPLVPRQLVDYLQSVLGARVVPVHLQPVTKDFIMRAWRGTTKGRAATARDTKKFESSGDMEIMGYALQQRGTIIILSNDNDIIGITRNLRLPRIKVFSYNLGQLTLSA